MQNVTKFRACGCALAVVFALYSVWFLAAELARPTLPPFPFKHANRETVGTHQSEAETAASIGIIRGDLWGEYALTASANLLNAIEAGDKAPAEDAMKQANAAAKRALSLAPHNSSAWLIFAALDSQDRKLESQAAEALRMSYFTGPNDAQLIPFRLSLAVRLDAIADPEMENLVRSEIRTVITRIPELKPAIVAAYRNAIPSGKRFLERTLEELEPALSRALGTTQTK